MPGETNEKPKSKVRLAEPEEWDALGLPRSEVVISPVSKKRTGKAKRKPAPKKDREWFERQVAELKAELEKLPANRQAQFRREFEQEPRVPPKLPGEALEYFRKQGAKGGKVGGKRRLETMTPEERSASARKASLAAAEKRTREAQERKRKK
jgi:hypothetical protein